MAENQKLKIGLILDTSLDPTDGVQQYVINIGEWLRSQGHDVHYLVGETTKRDLPNIHSLARNVGVRFNGNLTTIPLPVSKKKLGRVIEEENFDVLHVQSPHHPLMAQRLILAASKQTAVIGTFHVLPYGIVSRMGNRLLGMWLRSSLKRIDQMLAVSPEAAKFALKSFKVKAAVLPNVIEYSRFHGAKPFSRYNDGVPTILFFGRLVPRKGCLLLLEAVGKIVKKGNAPKFRVIICGAGPQEELLKNYVKSNGLQKIVEFTGFVKEVDKPRYYSSADIAVFPSSGGESFGIVLLEAMASDSKIVLGGNNPGYRCVLGDQPELLFGTANPNELADKILNMLGNSADTKKLHEWQQNEVKKYDVNVVGPKLVEIYRSSIAKRRSTRHN